MRLCAELYYQVHQGPPSPSRIPQSLVPGQVHQRNLEFGSPTRLEATTIVAPETPPVNAKQNTTSPTRREATNRARVVRRKRVEELEKSTMQSYLRRCYRQCQTEKDRQQMKELLTCEIGKITASGNMSSTDWAEKPLLVLHGQ